MFNLLRQRVRRKKHKNKNNDDNNVPKVSANKQTNIEQNIESNARQYVESDLYQNNAERILPTAVVAAAYVGTSISDTKTTKTQKDKENEEEEEEEIEKIGLYINNGITNNITADSNAGKIYFENAHNNDKRQYLAKTNENFAFKYNANGNIDEKYQKEEEAQVENSQRQRLLQRQRQRVKDLSNDLMVCGFSHNVPAEWQRRVLTIGEKTEILPNRNTTAEQVININKHNSQAFNCELVETQSTNENVEIKNKNNQIRADTSNRNNEVKYRNLDKSTSRNEGKRQSRLSFTLAGINFGKKKDIDEHQTLENVPQKLGPLKKSREYLNSLFMARGRQHNRHQRHQQQPQQQQLAKEQTKNVTYNCGGANNELKISTCTTMNNQIKNEESINTPINAQSFMNDKKETTTLFEQHLEPNVVRATELTNNNYQISSAKNSVEQNDVPNECRERTRERHLLRSAHSENLRSNSATILRAHSASPLPRNKRSRSVTFNEEVECFGEATNVWLNNGDDWISRTSQTERNGAENSNTDNENFALNSIVPNTNTTHGEGGVNSGAFPTANFITSTYQNPSHQELHINYQPYNNPEFTQLNQIDSLTPTSTLNFDMGQSNTKSDVTTRDFRESSVTPNEVEEAAATSSPINVEMPTITVADYSATLRNTPPATHVDKEVFYEIDNNEQMYNYNNDCDNKTASEDDDDNDAVFYDDANLVAPTMHDQYVKWQAPNNNGFQLSQPQMRHSHAKLEDVREEDEEEINHEESEEEDTEDEDDEEEESSVDEPRQRPRHLDNEHYNSSTERSPLKSSDTTLSGSASDSGIGTDTTSQPTTPLNAKTRYSPLRTAATATTTATKPPKPTQEVLTQHQKLRQQIKQKYNFMSFVRDGNSTDGDEVQLPCDDIELDLADDYIDEDADDDVDAQARLVCIESISLPDVVVESTTVSASNTLNSNSSNGEHIININGATGNSMGNVHFIPIHVEAANNNGTKKRSLDDSVIGNSIEITEDASVMNGFVVDNRQVEKLK